MCDALYESIEMHSKAISSNSLIALPHTWRIGQLSTCRALHRVDQERGPVFLVACAIVRALWGWNDGTFSGGCEVNYPVHCIETCDDATVESSEIVTARSGEIYSDTQE